jgi:hypothetical protein
MPATERHGARFLERPVRNGLDFSADVNEKR